MYFESMSRRGFVQKSVASLVAAGFPLWFAKETVAAQEAKKTRNSQWSSDGCNWHWQSSKQGSGDL